MSTPGAEIAIERSAYANAAQVVFCRPDQRNSITRNLLSSFNEALDRLERQEDVDAIVLRAKGEFFCAGMDFNEFALTRPVDADEPIQVACAAYFATLKRLVASNKLIVTLVEGRALAGGLGLVAASDVVLATSSAAFGLPELLWGLLPAMVIPFLARRVGAREAFKLSLAAQSLSANRALDIGLVDEVSDQPEQALQRVLARSGRLAPGAVSALKQYYQRALPIDADAERLAVETTANLVGSPEVRERIRRFVEQQRAPWERKVNS